MPFTRYSFTGAVATAVHYVILFMLAEGVGLPASIAAGLGALCGAGVAYLGNRYFTFATSLASHRRAAPRFLLVAAFGAALSGGIVWVGTALSHSHHLHSHYFVWQVMATVTTLVLTYGINRRWTFA